MSRYTIMPVPKRKQYAMGAKRVYRGKLQVMGGDGFWSTIGDALSSAGSKVIKLAKDLGVKPSTLIGFVPHPAAQAAAATAKTLGLGRKKKHAKRKGGSMLSGDGHMGGNWLDSTEKVLKHYAFGKKHKGGSKPPTGVSANGHAISHYGPALATYDKHPHIIKQKYVGQGFLTMPMSLNGGVGINTLGNRL